MTGSLSRAWKIYAAVCAAAVTVAILGIAVGLWAFPERLASVWDTAIHGPAAAPDEAARLEADRAKLEGRQREFEESRRLREAELRRLELMAQSALARSRAERERAEAEARRVAEAQPEKAQQQFESNLDLLSRMSPATSLAVMKSWDDATVTTHLRAMRPGRAAEIVDAMRADPAWQERLPRILPP